MTALIIATVLLFFTPLVPLAVAGAVSEAGAYQSRLLPSAALAPGASGIASEDSELPSAVVARSAPSSEIVPAMSTTASAAAAVASAWAKLTDTPSMVAPALASSTRISCTAAPVLPRPFKASLMPSTGATV